MATSVVILNHVEAILNSTPDLIARIHHDLQTALASYERVTVHAVVSGFERNFSRKIILAVEADNGEAFLGGSRFRSFIAKLGYEDAVASDYDGWSTVVRDRRVSPRLFLSVQRVALSAVAVAGGRPRCAVLYEDAAQYYRDGTQTDGILNLHDAVLRAVESNLYTVDSLVRVLREIFQELGQSFYSCAKISPAAVDFYKQKLRMTGAKPSAMNQWQTDLAALRRMTTWLSCGNISPAAPQSVVWHDPFDYVSWLLNHGEVPKTFVGPSHGDLHGKNILVDCTGDKEASFRDVQSPTLIDYGDMALNNVPMWDYVKLETELKVRLLTELYRHQEIREEVFSAVETGNPFARLLFRWKRLNRNGSLPNSIDEENRWTLFVLLFEQRLNQRLNQVFHSDDLTQDRDLLAEAASPASRLAAAETALHSIRRESARWLCHKMGRQSHDEWRDEFDFALAVYGLSTSKFSDNSYLQRNRIAALVSAGAAVTRFERRRKIVQARCAGSFNSGPQPSYLIPLFHGYQAWKRHKDWPLAATWFESAHEQFPTAIPLIREYALMLASQGAELDRKSKPGGQELRKKATALIEGVATEFHESSLNPYLQAVTVCEAFDDLELLSRTGRIYKDLGDIDWTTSFPNLKAQDLGNRPPGQHYGAARDYYRAAFAMSQDHYPGGNYAVTALLAGNADEARQAASQVADLCKQSPLSQMNDEDRFWLFATESTMALILQEPQDAAAFLESALALVNSGGLQALQSTYDQFCRLYCALEPHIFEPLLGKLKACPTQPQKGPLTDCGGYH